MESGLPILDALADVGANGTWTVVIYAGPYVQ